MLRRCDSIKGDTILLFSDPVPALLKKALDFYSQEAKERQREAGILYGENHPKQEVGSNLSQPLDTGTAAEKAGKVPSGVNTIQREKPISRPLLFCCDISGDF